MDPLQQPPPEPHRRGRPPPHQPQQRQPRRPQQQQQPYPYNPTLHDLTNHNHHPTNGVESLFRNAFVTKVIVLFTIVFYFLQQQQQHQPTNDKLFSYRNMDETTTNVWKIILRPHSNSYYSYIISKIIFFVSRSSTTSIQDSMNPTNHQNHYSNSTVVLIMNVLYQYYLYRIMERQMSSYQFVRFLLYLVVGTVVLEYVVTYVTIVPAVVFGSTDISGSSMRLRTLRDVVVASSSTLIYGPYSIMGALCLYYHWYIPRIYPRFVTILSMFHFSEKSLFYFYTIYFVMINSKSMHHPVPESYIFLHTYHGTISVILSMCFGMVLSIVYYYLSNHPIVVYYYRLVDDRIVQPIVVRYTNTLATATANNRTRNTNNIDRRHATNANNRVAEPPPQLRQRHIAAATAAAANDNDRNHPWIHDNEIDTDVLGAFTAAATAAAAASNTLNEVPLLPVENVDNEAVEQLCNMGFERPHVILALRQSHNNIEHAANRLLSSSSTTAEVSDD